MKRIFSLTIILALTLACPDQPYCSRCIGETFDSGPRCLVCNGGYVNQAGVCTPVNYDEMIPHCIDYKAPSEEGARPTCNRCKNGFGFMDKSNSDQCVACADPNCELCHLADKCLACKGLRKSVVGKSGESVCLEEVESIPNCSWAYPVEQTEELWCAGCLPGFARLPVPSEIFYRTFKCIESRHAHCQDLDEKNPSSCDVCEPGYTVTSQGTCELHAEFVARMASQPQKLPQKPSDIDEKTQPSDQILPKEPQNDSTPNQTGEPKETPNQPGAPKKSLHVPPFIKWIFGIGIFLLVVTPVVLWLVYSRRKQADPTLAHELQVTQA